MLDANELIKPLAEKLKDRIDGIIRPANSPIRLGPQNG